MNEIEIILKAAIIDLRIALFTNDRAKTEAVLHKLLAIKTTIAGYQTPAPSFYMNTQAVGLVQSAASNILD